VCPECYSKENCYREEGLFLAQELIIAKAKVNGKPKYKSYRNVCGLKKPVPELLSASGINLNNVGPFNEFEQFKIYLTGYKIILIVPLNTDSVIFSGNFNSKKKL
jgi:hypothetical protein